MDNEECINVENDVNNYMRERERRERDRKKHRDVCRACKRANINVFGTENWSTTLPYQLLNGHIVPISYTAAVNVKSAQIKKKEKRKKKERRFNANTDPNTDPMQNTQCWKLLSHAITVNELYCPQTANNHTLACNYNAYCMLPSLLQQIKEWVITTKGVNSNDITWKQQRPESSLLTLSWHVSKYKEHELHLWWFRPMLLCLWHLLNSS